MKIHLPNSAFLGNIDPFLRSFDPVEPEILEITANKKWISVHPVVLCIVAALGLITKETTIETLEATSKHYLERMGLFNFLNVVSGIQIEEHESAGRFIPLTQIKSSSELSTFLTDMLPLLHATPKHAETIKYIISELVRNVLEHAQTTHGAIVCAQYYKKSNSIRIGIADTGIGIKAAITNAHLAKDDLSAIRLALMPGITGTTRMEGGTEQNAGAGLFFIKSIATFNRDFFMLYSGKGMYKLLTSKEKAKLRADPFRDHHSKESNYPYWQGTVVGIDITLDTTAEFSALLDFIRETYIRTIKERKKKKYRRPRFT